MLLPAWPPATPTPNPHLHPYPLPLPPQTWLWRTGWRSCGSCDMRTAALAWCSAAAAALASGEAAAWRGAPRHGGAPWPALGAMAIPSTNGSSFVSLSAPTRPRPTPAPCPCPLQALWRGSGAAGCQPAAAGGVRQQRRLHRCEGTPGSAAVRRCDRGVPAWLARRAPCRLVAARLLTR